MRSRIAALMLVFSACTPPSGAPSSPAAPLHAGPAVSAQAGWKCATSTQYENSSTCAKGDGCEGLVKMATERGKSYGPCLPQATASCFRFVMDNQSCQGCAATTAGCERIRFNAVEHGGASEATACADWD